MRLRSVIGTAVIACMFFGTSILAQQKGQWVAGQVGLNAGILPSPGFTDVNMDINYSANTLNERNGNAVPVTGSYDS